MIDHHKIDEFEGALIQGELIECPLVHRFTKGLYIRELFMPSGLIATTKIHKTQHPFIISKGKVNVMIGDRIETLEAPYCGITEPGTRRILFVIEDCTWTTIHRNDDDSEDLLEIENRLIEAHDNPLLPDEIKQLYNLTQNKLQ
jgi:hypothetical protein